MLVSRPILTWQEAQGINHPVPVGPPPILPVPLEQPGRSFSKPLRSPDQLSSLPTDSESQLSKAPSMFLCNGGEEDTEDGEIRALTLNTHISLPLTSRRGWALGRVGPPPQEAGPERGGAASSPDPARVAALCAPHPRALCAPAAGAAQAAADQLPGPGPEGSASSRSREPGARWGHGRVPQSTGSPLQRSGRVSSPQDTHAPPRVPGPHSKQASPEGRSQGLRRGTGDP